MSKNQADRQRRRRLLLADETAILRQLSASEPEPEPKPEPKPEPEPEPEQGDILTDEQVNHAASVAADYLRPWMAQGRRVLIEALSGVDPSQIHVSAGILTEHLLSIKDALSVAEEFQKSPRAALLLLSLLREQERDSAGEE